MQLTCGKCQSFICYPERYSGECPRCIMLEQVQALKDRVEDIFLPRLTVVELIEALGRILEYQPAPSPFREDGIWPHLSAGSHSAE